MPSTSIWNPIQGICAIVCVIFAGLTWGGIKPQHLFGIFGDAGMKVGLKGRSPWVWVACLLTAGMALFGRSIFVDLYPVHSFDAWISIGFFCALDVVAWLFLARQGKHGEDLYESAKLNLEYRERLSGLEADLRMQSGRCDVTIAAERLKSEEAHQEEIRKIEMQHKHELENAQEAYRQCMLERGAFMEGAENSIAQLARFKDQSVSDSDPYIYLEFVDARATTMSDKKENQAYFTLVNRGGSEARNVVLESIEMDGNTVQFTRHKVAASLLPKREAYFHPDVTKDNKSVNGWDNDLFSLFYQDYLALGDRTICEAAKVITATYQDSTRNLFEVSCELVLDPSAHLNVRQGNRGASPVIYTRNHRFRKIARAI